MRWTIANLLAHCGSVLVQLENGKYVPMRPAGRGLRDRVKSAWEVLVGRADAVVWEKQ